MNIRDSPAFGSQKIITKPGHGELHVPAAGLGRLGIVQSCAGRLPASHNCP